MNFLLSVRPSSNLSLEDLKLFPYKREVMENFRVRLFFKNEPDAVLYWQKVLPTLENVDLRDIRSEIEADKALVKEIQKRKQRREVDIKVKQSLLRALVSIGNFEESYKDLKAAAISNDLTFH